MTAVAGMRFSGRTPVGGFFGGPEHLDREPNLKFNKALADAGAEQTKT